MLLKTCMRCGEISYQPEDIRQREGEWQPPGECEADLMERYKSSPEVIVKFVSRGNGNFDVDVKTPWRRKVLNCFMGFLDCMRRCFWGLIHCMRLTWAWLRDNLRC